MAAFVGLGLCSITVGALFFQGPLTQITARGPHGHVHTQTMTRADEKVLSSLETGTVIAPRPFGDILSTRPGIHTLYGVASVHADQEVRLLEPLVAEFFSPDPPHGMREAALKEWCVDYVFCPDTWPLSESIVESLGREPSLLLIAEEGRAKLFRVRNFGP